jgi:hypothetical protein
LSGGVLAPNCHAVIAKGKARDRVDLLGIATTCRGKHVSMTNPKLELVEGPPESEGEVQGPVEQVEEAIREFVRQDVTQLRRLPTSEAPTEVVNGVNSLVQRVAGSSLREMQNVIWELENLRDFLQSEGERIQREIANYAQLTQAAMSSTRTIADNMVHWKKAADGGRAS